jgi:hypothetical protein
MVIWSSPVSTTFDSISAQARLSEVIGLVIALQAGEVFPGAGVADPNRVSDLIDSRLSPLGEEAHNRSIRGGFLLWHGVLLAVAFSSRWRHAAIGRHGTAGIASLLANVAPPFRQSESE